ncbi:MAG: hypothetical protein R3Y29_01145 [bacterium]
MIIFNLISTCNTLGSSFGIKQYGESVKFSQTQNIKNKSKKQDESQEDEQKTEAERIQDILKLNAEDNQKASKIGSIDSKLKSGKKLTKEDLEYLKSNMPDLYEEAKVVERERSSYEYKLENASSKQEVQKIQEEKAVEFGTKVKNIMNNTLLSDDKKYKLMMQVHSSLASVSEVHNDFINSRSFQDLPDETDLQKEEMIQEEKSPKEDINQDINQDTNQDINQDININTPQEKLNMSSIQQDIKSATSILSKRLILKGD